MVILAREAQEEKIFRRILTATPGGEISPHPMMSGQGRNVGRGGRGYTRHGRIHGVPQERRRTLNPLRGKTEFLANETVKVNPQRGKTRRSPQEGISADRE